jgi:NADP-dependent 3-hydroxy acid dehydrogenase YdfG
MISPETPITDKIALITGGSSGIGLATSELFSSLKIKVITADIRPPINNNKAIQHFMVDVGNAKDIDFLYHQVTKLIGHPNILICNAGRGIHEKLAEGDPEKWARIIQTNLMGALRIIRAFVPDMIKSGGGEVVFISSVSAEKPYEYGGVYSATKVALEAIAEALRLEVQPQIRVTTIVPGMVDTDFFKNSMGGSHNPQKLEWGALNAAEVADAIVYAISRPKEVSLNKIVIRPSAQSF